eukprot:TRINITY_DN4895_c0_g1_i1.p1 TRINITY_DN4895_c0_g1~~TRINITY_DN4895_c0_g1_i1.p1  ORF type:complete len:112 (+),score=31.82 TRINITY_DN4895_c0_g1_i1:1-336(+)
MEARIAEAEARLSALTSELASIEAQLKAEPVVHISGESSESLHKFQRETLVELQQLREVLGTERNEALALKEKHDRLEVDQEKLKKENERLKYRILHLLRSLEEEEAKGSH